MATPPRGRVPSSAPRRGFTQRFSGFTLVLIGTIIVGVLALAPGLKNLVEQRQQISALQAKVTQQQNTVQSLSEQTDRWQDPAYIKAQTRQRLFFVVPGEKTFVVIDDNGSAAAARSVDAAPTTSITSTVYDWRQLVAQSWYSAATSTAEAAPSDSSGGR